MNTQLELIPQTKHIPQWLADYFFKANSGIYPQKQDFYDKIKNEVLESKAEFIGYELQIIEYKCRSCFGTGKYKHYHYEYDQRYLIGEEPCWHCIDGIYAVREFTLKKFVLNGVVYHIPGDFNNKVKHLPTVVRGKIQHEHIDSNDATNAFIILLWWYNKNEFHYRLKKLAKLKLELIQKLIQKDNTNDELPF